MFRQLLLFVGISWIILRTESYTYPTSTAYSTSIPTAYSTSTPNPAAYGYLPYTPTLPSYSTPTTYGNGFTPYGYDPFYSSNCETMKVIEVLDQLFCQHIKRDRYSTTLHPTVKSIISQLKWTLQLVFIEEVYDNMVGAIDNLKYLKDSVEYNYEESYLLDEYTGTRIYPGHDGVYGNQDPAYDVSGTNYAASKFATLKQLLDNLVKETTTFKTQRGGYSQPSYGYTPSNMQAPYNSGDNSYSNNEYASSPTYATQQSTPYASSSLPASYSPQNAYPPDQSQSSYDNTEDPYVVAPRGSYDNEQYINYNQRSAGSGSGTEVVDTSNDAGQESANKFALDVVQEDHNEDSEILRRKRSTELPVTKSHKTRGAVFGRGTRKNRAVQYSDNTCALVSPIKCSEDSYDELLNNMLVYLYTAADQLFKAIAETDDFMKRTQCGNSGNNAYQEAAISFGSMLTSFYSIIDVAEQVEKMHKVIVLEHSTDYTYSGYYRAGGEDTSYSPPELPPTYVDSVPEPNRMSVPLPNGQSYTAPALQTYPYSTYINPSSYSLPNQYRSTRASSAPPAAFSWMFFMH